MKLIPRFNKFTVMYLKRRDIIPRFSRKINFSFYGARENIKKLSILGIVGIFLFSTVLCCCFTKTVNAEELTSSCHQTTHESESSQSAKECDCEHSITTAQKATFLKNSLVQVFTITLDQLFSDYSTISAKVDIYQAPPLVLRHLTALHQTLQPSHLIFLIQFAGSN